MIFRKEKGRYEGVTSGGQVVPFDSGAEMLACAELRSELLRLVGREPEEQISLMQNAKCKVQREEETAPKKKRVRIRIDSEVEYIGNSEFAWQKEKAFA